MSDLALTAAGRLHAAPPERRLAQAARAFEAQFVARLLAPLAERGEDEEELLGGDGAGDQWRALFVQGLSEQAAGRLGVAELVERTLAARLPRAQ